METKGERKERERGREGERGERGVERGHNMSAIVNCFLLFV
jgi:hypothetical protein